MKPWLIILLTTSLIYSCKEEKTSETSTTNTAQKALVESLTLQVQQHPDSSPVRMLLVNALDSMGNFAAALAQVDSMIYRDSLNNGLWFAKGQLQESLKDTTAAIRSYENAVSIYPSVQSQLSLANLYAEKGDKRSLAICQSVGRLGLERETVAHCDFIAGVYHARTGQPQKAVPFFDRCINNNYTYMEAYMEKGFIYFEQKNYTQALQVFDKAITVNNQYADAYYWKAKTNEAAGNKTEAITDYQRALGFDKNLQEARVALERLGS